MAIKTTLMSPRSVEPHDSQLFAKDHKSIISNIYSHKTKSSLEHLWTNQSSFFSLERESSFLFFFWWSRSSIQMHVHLWYLNLVVRCQFIIPHWKLLCRWYWKVENTKNNLKSCYHSVLKKKEENNQFNGFHALLKTFV